MRQKGEYNKGIADKILKEFISLTGFDLHKVGRKPKDAYTRCLLYKVLNDSNDMNDRMITEYFKTKGKKINRVSVFQSLRKVEYYHEKYSDFREMYSLCFSKEIPTPDVIQKVEMDELDIFISNLAQEKRKEILELVTLRVKSWGWKAKNKCQIIEGSGDLAGTW
tara:strand:- start:581 stop:1075 length:495 start_codon:yes stop_codon:yes gene_type:complete